MLDTRNAHIYGFDYAVDIPDIFQEKRSKIMYQFCFKS